MINQRLNRYLLIFFFPVVFVSCSPPVFKTLFRSSNDRVLDTLKASAHKNYNPAISPEYHIQAEDMLGIKNISYKQIAEGGVGGGGGNGGGGNNGNGGGGGATDGFRVESDGYVNLPKIGKVYVLNMTRKEATEKIGKMYRDSLLEDPVIDVSVLGQRVSILGEVQQQGTYYLDRDNVTLMEVIAIAGGFKTSANPGSVKIIRGDKQNPEEIYLNLENLSSIATKSILLQNKDVIYVGADSRFHDYEKKQSGIAIFQSVLLVFSSLVLVYTTFFK